MSYAASIVPDRAFVLGHRLEPFTLGHAHLLDLVQSPFLRGGAPALGDLVLAVELCRISWEKARELLQYPGLAKRVEKIGKRICRRRLGYESDDFSEFVAYLSEATNGPGFWVKSEENQKKTSGSPWLQSLKSTLLRGGRTYAETMNTPLREALWDFAAYWEQEGSLEIQSETEQAILEAAKAQDGGQ
jgi:hypothetical protein